MNKTSRPHHESMVELLRQDPAFADEYLTAALDEADQPGGRVAPFICLAANCRGARHGDCCGHGFTLG